LSSPLGQWLIETAKAQALPAATVRFDVSHHDRKISMLKPLVGRTGWLRLEKLTLDSDAREEYLLFTAVTDEGENVDQEQIQRLMDVPGEAAIAPPPAIGDAPAARLAADADRHAQASLARASEAGDERFRKVQMQVDQWADDKVTAAEMELETLRRDLRAVRRRAELAETVAAQRNAMEQVTQLEAKRRRARRNIDEVEDTVEQERQKLLGQLQARCQQHHSRETLFTIRFLAV